MQAFTRLTGIAAPLSRPNINTDDIWPGPAASPVYRRSPGGFGGRATAADNLFAAWRYDDALAPRADFVLNHAPYDRATILIGGANFGCGSSREIAVWALAGAGFRCVVATSFGDIFHDNCIKNGVLPATVEAAGLAALLEAVPASASPALLTVDLEARVLTLPDGSTIAFAINDYPRMLLLGGLDEIDAACADHIRIDRFAAAHALRQPWLSLSPTPAPDDRHQAARHQ